MLSRPADARVRARFRVGAKQGVFRGENGGGAGVFCTMAFGGKGGKAGGKTRKIRPSGGHLCSFRYVAGRSVQDCGKVVQKLAGREDEKYKLCTTLCAPLRHGTRIVQVSFPRCVRCVGVVVRRCAIRSFSLPPAEAGCPFRRRGRGGRQTEAGRTHGRGGLLCEGASAFAFALPHPAHGASPISGRERGGRQAVAGRTHGQGRGWPCALPPLRTVIRHTSGIARHASGIVRHCARERPPLPSPSPTLRTAARTFPGSGRRANDILYIRVRRREGENVLHRTAGNDVDNFSVDNPLWITAAAGCRLLCGGRGRRYGGSVNEDGGSVNAGAEVRTRTGRVRKSSRGKCERGYENANADGAGAEGYAGDGCSQGASFGPMAAISRRGQGGRIYNNTRARVLLRQMCVKLVDLTTHSPSKAFARPAQRHALPEHFRSPTQRRPTPAGCAMHSPPTSPPIPRQSPPLAPHSDMPFPSTPAPPRSADACPQAARCLPRRPHNPFPAEDLRSPPHSDTPFPSTSAPPRSPEPRPQAARCIPRRPHNPFPAQRRPASPSVPLRAQKNGTAQCMCDAECLGRPSLRSVIWVGEPRAVRRRYGALACRRGA